MLFCTLVAASRRVGETSKRLAKTDVLAALLHQAHGEEIEIAVAFLSGFPRQGKLGAGYRMIQQARAEPANAAELTIIDVDRELTALAETRGTGAKVERLTRLLSRCTAEEQDFLRRLLTGELRQGALEGIVIEGIAKASGISSDRVRRAVMLAGDAAVVARVAIEQGEAGLAGYDVQLFRPVQPMLAQTAEDVVAALAELGEAALEFKMDGARVQVHRSGDEVRVYTRNLNDVTVAVPEVVEAVRALPLRDAILDGEVLSFMPDGKPQPFQVTMRRFGRKLDVANMRASLPLTPYFFDLLYIDGGSLLDESQERRFHSMTQVMPPSMVIPNLRTADPGKAAEFVRSSLDRGHEGVMAKSPASLYAAGARGQSWLKIKQPRTLDLVILAAEWGSGRRQGWLSNLHLGARDTVNGGFQMLGKTFKGLTDEMLAWQTAELQKLEVSRDNWTVYVAPQLVAEIAFNEIQTSSRYPSGLALRFARVKRYRPDKSPGAADTFETVQRLAGLLP